MTADILSMKSAGHGFVIRKVVTFACSSEAAW